MNRKQRRAAKAREANTVVEIKIGRCLMAGEGTATCFVCGNEAKDWHWPDGPWGPSLGYGVAGITCHCGQCNEPFNVPLCERCFTSSDVSGDFMRTIHPDTEITHGGYYDCVETLMRDLETPVRRDGALK
jgi:hypothetical protein